MATGAGELLSLTSVDTSALVLKALFYGVPLATRREEVARIRDGYRTALDLFLERVREDGRA
jgi:hypothetical protein